MKKVLFLGFLLATVFAPPSFAGKNEAKVCAEKLAEAAKKIFLAVTPKLEPRIDARKVMKSTVIDLVRSGEVDRLQARSSAQAAGECLKKLQD